MHHILITGPRNLTPKQQAIASHRLQTIWHHTPNSHWHVGCASGVDAIARQTCDSEKLTIYRAQSRDPWELQARSRRMVDACESGTLYAFPNKNCPQGLTLKSWKGSGTWGTVFYAHSKGFKIELNWLMMILKSQNFYSSYRFFRDFCVRGLIYLHSPHIINKQKLLPEKKTHASQPPRPPIPSPPLFSLSSPLRMSERRSLVLWHHWNAVEMV